MYVSKLNFHYHCKRRYHYFQVICLSIDHLKSFQNKKGLKIFQLPTFWCLFLQLAAEKKHRKVGSWKILGPSYFEATLGPRHMPSKPNEARKQL